MPTAERNLRNAVLLQRVANGIGRSASAEIRALFEEIAAEIARVSPTGVRVRYREGRVLKLLAQLDVLFQGRYRNLLRGVVEDLVTLGMQQSRFAVEGLPDAAERVLARKRVREIVTKSAVHGLLVREWVEGSRDQARRQVEQQIRLAVGRGETNEGIARAARRAQRRARRDVRGVIRTSSTFLSSKTRLDTYRLNRGVIAAIEFVATLDERTTPICGKWDGTQWDVGDPAIQVPPLHFNCRSTLVPVVDYEKAGIPAPPEGQRAAKGGPVKASVTYRQWFRKQPAKVQDSIVGPTRGRMLRKGEISFAEMIARDNRVLTLDELRGGAT